MLRSIGDALSKAGHEVHVLSSIPSYRSETSSFKTLRHENLVDLKVQRVWVFANEKKHPILRLVNVFLYCCALFVKVLRLRPNVVTASTFPPVAAAWSASLAARIVGAKFIYHIQDIHPELSVYSGGRLGQGILFRLLQCLDNQTLRRSAEIIVLSKDMAHTLVMRDLGKLPVHVINNFSLKTFEESKEPSKKLRKRLGKRRVIFAGNLGKFQNLSKMVKGVSYLFADFPDLELFFLGDGSAVSELKRRWADHPQVSFGPFMPFAQAKVLIAEADVGLISMLPGIYRVAYPSKVLSYAGLGVPMLALVEPESELAKDLQQGGIGAVPNRDTPEAIAAALEVLLRNTIAPSKVRAWHDTIADSERIYSEWCVLVEGLKPR
jgi:colanic acid biosynthesis glycosyl transferase WcaI